MKCKITECKAAASMLRLARFVLSAVVLGMCVTAFSAKPGKGNGIPKKARPDVVRAVEEAARRPHPRLFADADGFATSVVRRGEMAASGRSYTLRDAFTGVRPGGKIRWAMMTRAEPTIEGDKVTLRQNGKSITLVQCGAQKGTWSVGNGQGPNKWDSPNPGCRQLMFTVQANADGTASIAVPFSIN